MTKAKSSWFWKCDIGLRAESTWLFPLVANLSYVAGFYPHLRNGLKVLVTSRAKDLLQAASLGSDPPPQPPRGQDHL